MSRFYEWVAGNGVVPLLWSLFGMAVVGFATYQVFADVTKINAAVSSALGIVYGLPTIAIGVWQWRAGVQAKKGKQDAVQ